MDRFERAKSIDLCFNPLTVRSLMISFSQLLRQLSCRQKESKLVRARKTPGWIEYDNEIANFSKRLVEEGVLHSYLAAADTASLAQAGNQNKGNDTDIDTAEIPEVVQEAEAPQKTEKQEPQTKDHEGERRTRDEL
jgi:UDP-glucose:glycoprotein glucosyltransferase